MGVPVGILGHGVVLGQELAGQEEEACPDGSLEERGWETREMGQQWEAQGGWRWGKFELVRVRWQ